MSFLSYMQHESRYKDSMQDFSYFFTFDILLDSALATLDWSSLFLIKCEMIGAVEWPRFGIIIKESERNGR